jgi:hypothetical protein
MDLNELIMLSAASLLGPSMKGFGHSQEDIKEAVSEAKALWKEILKQARIRNEQIRNG